ncbi:MAG: 50S ribosomal protein L15 [Deltaproteobacteria bacterium]|nr:50S ribosomal protein L15 [Deltaproteobacteria bacterium]
MRLNELKPAAGARRRKKRIGRGEGSGHGGTSTKGHKGAKARAGGKLTPGFEGGQMPLQRRLPKRGFHNPFRREYAVVNVGDLDRFPAGTVVDPALLKTSGLVKGNWEGVKVLGEGSLSHGLTVRVHRFSLSARDKIERAGGKAEVL